jgi:predicted Zn-dependent peptidase
MTQPAPHRPAPRWAPGSSRLRRTLCGSLLALSALSAIPSSGGARQTGSPPPSMDGRDLPVQELVLSNGMRFFLLPRDGVPTVSFVTHVQVGSVNESLGGTGIAHFLEHLLFKGSTTIGSLDLESERRLFTLMDAAHDSLIWERGALPSPDAVDVARLEGRIRILEDSARAVTVPNEFDLIVARSGARGLNATTTYEATQYFVNLPANRAKLWFVLEADRLRNPVFREFYAERDVIAEERRTRTDTSPGGMLNEEHLAAAFRAHPYGVPPVGHMDDIRALSRPTVEEFYGRYYGPGNVVVAIVGAFDADSAAVWAKQYFEPLAARDPPPPVLIREPEQRGERRIELLYDAEPQIRIGWKVPEATHPDAPALAMLANILVGGRDSRLYRRLVREDRLATSVTAGTGPGNRDPGLFTIHAIPRAPHTPEEVEVAIHEELERLRSVPPTPEEMDRVRTRLEADAVRRLVSNQGLAFQLVASHAFWGDWRETFRVQDRMREVDAEDLLAVLDRHLRTDRRTTAVLRRGDPR